MSDMMKCPLMQCDCIGFGCMWYMIHKYGEYSETKGCAVAFIAAGGTGGEWFMMDAGRRANNERA